MKTFIGRIGSFTAFLVLGVFAALSPTLLVAQISTPSIGGTPAAVDLSQISATARQQIRELTAEKEARTPAQRKIGSSLLYAAQTKRGQPITQSVAALISSVPDRADGLVDVEIIGKSSKPLIAAIEQSGGRVLYGRLTSPVLRALVPLLAVESLAAHSDVRIIRQTIPAATQQQLLKQRAERLRSPLNSAIQRLQGRISAAPAVFALSATGSVTSEGVKAHRADQALHFFGATGAGVKIGVLSESDDFKEQSITTGDLPADEVTIPGQDGRPGAGEGTAMMEIVHDMAPGAKLFFATAFNGPQSFADNIRALRFVYHCDVIVDDVIYFFESPYQDDIIAQAVNDVTADGAMYFSSAGNAGSFNDGTSGTWEGDYKKAKTSVGALPTGYDVHDFGQGIVSDRITVGGGPLLLHWSDPSTLAVPQAADDYDLFVLDSTLSNVVIASTDVQNGTGLPFEFLGFNIPAGFRVVIGTKTGTSTPRALRLQLSGGGLALATGGATYGHNSAAAAFGIAAVDAATANGGAFTGGLTNPVEVFSSDGYRRVFFDSAGNAYKPGKFLFKNGGGQLRYKPDLAAADGVSTTLPSSSGLNPFFGTSAAAPHAAAIAGLLKSAIPTIKPTKVRNALTKTALDIGILGRDRDSGFGIADAYGALTFVGAKPSPFLEFGMETATPLTGDGDAFIEPGETASLSTQLVNTGGATALNVNSVLSTTTPGVTILNGNSAFPPIGSLNGTAVNTTPFTFGLSSTAACGLAPTFTLTSTYSNPALSPLVVTFKVPTGQPDPVATPTSYAGAVVPIPDGSAPGVDIPLTVTGGSAISHIAFSFDGAACNSDVGSTTVGLDHSWVGDLVVKLTSPSGTTVTLISRAGGTLNSGNNFCQTVLDDGGVSSIQNVVSTDAPFTGTFAPANPLAAFNGEDANGTWVLNVSDNALFDTGNVRAFSLAINGFTCN